MCWIIYKKTKEKKGKKEKRTKKEGVDHPQEKVKTSSIYYTRKISDTSFLICLLPKASAVDEFLRLKNRN